MPKNILTPAEIFDYRLAALLGYADIDVMKASMSARSYAGWQKYWAEEPWGSWRDNLHTSLIAREVRRTKTPSFQKLDVFFYKNPITEAQSAEQKVFSALATMAKTVSAKEVHKRMKIVKLNRKKQKRRKAHD